MGELLLSIWNTNRSAISLRMLGPWAGFFTGWTYWFCWVVTGIAVVAFAYASSGSRAVAMDRFAAVRTVATRR